MLRTRSGKTFGRTVTVTNTMPGGDVNNLAPRQLAPNVAVPTVFTGNSGEDFEKWVKSFERVAKANDWPNDRLVNIMPAYISGRAGDLLDEVDAGLTYVEFKAKLSALLNPDEARRLHYSDLFVRKMKDNESVEGYAKDIVALVNKAYGDKIPDEHKQTLMREHFLHGLNIKLRTPVCSRNPKSFDDARNYAKHQETLNLFDEREATGTQSLFDSNITSSACSKPSHEDMNSALVHCIKDLTKEIQELKVNKENPPQVGQQQSRWSSRRTPDGRPICDFCRKPGHIKASCRSWLSMRNPTGSFAPTAYTPTGHAPVSVVTPHMPQQFVPQQVQHGTMMFPQPQAPLNLYRPPTAGPSQWSHPAHQGQQ